MQVVDAGADAARYTSVCACVRAAAAVQFDTHLVCYLLCLSSAPGRSMIKVLVQIWCYR